MNPDLVLDLSEPLDPSALHHTVRFGEIRLRPGMFSRITAFELLEHVADLPRAMLNFLTLLEEGGDLRLSVPYELSQGAWQDPTHVRAFNEKSWLYYTSWAWYMGWREERFELEDMVFVLSEYGRLLEAGGTEREDLLRLPRAVDGMRVVLRKRASTRSERDEFDALTRAFYRGAVGEWLVRDAGE
jgi:SAM-dependent methyltransferase